MKPGLKEQIPRGTFLFPFQLYENTNPSGSFLTPYHWHGEIELLYFLRGEVTLTVNGARYAPHPGDFYFINSEELHELSSSDRSILYYAYVFPLSFLHFEQFDYTQSKYIGRLSKKKLLFPRRLVPKDEAYTCVQNEMEELIRAQEKQENGYQLFCKAALYKIIAELLRTDALLQETKEEGQFSPEKTEHLRRILTYIAAHFSEKLALTDIARAFHMTPKYFSKYFKQNFGKTFVDYVNGARIEKACALLRETETPVMEVAFSVGFDNFSYFIKRFKETMGCTPLAYRRLGYTV